MLKDVPPQAKSMLSRAGDILNNRKKGKNFFAFFLIFFLGLTVYSNSFGVPFQFDDYSSIVENPVIRHLDNFTSSLEGYHYNPRRVVGYATFALNYHFGGLNTVGYHVVNLAVHVTNGFLVYFLIILTFETPYFREQSAKGIAQRATAKESIMTGGRKSLAQNKGVSDRYALRPMPYAMSDSRFLMALFAALLFVTHPLQTESVTYIVQRFASLAAMFYLLSMVFYIRGRLGAKGGGQEAVGVEKRVPIAYRLVPIACYFLSFLFAVLAMGTKEIAYTLPIMIVIFEFLFFTRVTRKRLLFLVAPVAIIGLAVLALANSGVSPGRLLSRLEAVTMVQSYGSRWIYLITELRVIMSYIRLMIFPVNQSIDYDYPIYHSLLTPEVLLSAFFLSALFGAAVYLLWKSKKHSAKGIAHRAGSLPPTSNLQLFASRQAEDSGVTFHDSGRHAPCSMPSALYLRLISFGILWFFVTLSVESSVVPIADVIFEHRMYLPSVGAMIAVAAAAFMISGRLAKKGRTAAVIMLTVIVTLFAAATYARNDVWASPITLWKDAIRKGPHHSRPYFVLGAEYARHGAYGKAIAMYRKALAMPPGEYLTLRADEYPKMYNALGLLYARLGRYGEAIEVFQRLLGRYPGFAGAYNNLGAAYVNSGRYREAIRPLQQAVDRRPGNVDARYNLALAYYGSGDRDAAMREALILKRFSPEAASELLAQLK